MSHFLRSRHNNHVSNLSSTGDTAVRAQHIRADFSVFVFVVSCLGGKGMSCKLLSVVAWIRCPQVLLSRLADAGKAQWRDLHAPEFLSRVCLSAPPLLPLSFVAPRPR